MRPTPAQMLVRLVFGVRQKVMARPVARAALRALGWPLIRLMHATVGAAPPPTPTPAAWAEPVLRLPLDYDPGPLTSPPRVAVLLHAFSVEVLPEIARALRNLPASADLFVSTDTDAKRGAIAAAFPDWPGAVDIRLVPNRGRNVAPQLTAFRDVYDSYPLVLWLHTKTSSHTDELAGWRSFLLENLLGSPGIVRGALEAFARLPALGVLAPRTFPAARRHMVWGENYAACRGLAERMGFALAPDSPLDFPAGAMFWARSAALKPLLDLGLTPDDFPPEAGQTDATLAHAVERLVFHACELAGLGWARGGTATGLAPPEAAIRAEIPRQLQRILTDGARTVLDPGRHPHPTWTSEAPPPPPVAERKAAFRHLCRTDLDAFLAGDERLVLPTSEAPEVSIVLVLFNQAELTFQCLRALRFGLDAPSEIIIVDNASSDATADLLARVDGAQVVRNASNIHFLRGVNQGAGMARGRALLLLNNDARPARGAIGAALATLDGAADIGAVGGRIDLLDDTLQEAGSIIRADGACEGYGRGADPLAPEFQFRRQVDYCSGAFLMVRRALFETLGRFDAAFAPAYYEETDLCMRIRAAGSRVVYDPAVVVSHFEFASSQSPEAALDLQRERQALFARKHAPALAAGYAAPGAPALEARMRGAFRGRLLVLDDQVPFHDLGAGYPRAAALLQAAMQAGWFVTAYPTVEADVDFLRARAALSPDLEIAAEQGRAGLAAFLKARAGYYDAVIVSRPQNMALLREVLAKAPGLLRLDQVIYDAEAIFARRTPGGGVERELALARGVSSVLAVSAGEAAVFREAGARAVHVVGHALTPSPTPSGFAARGDLLFVGALDEDDSPNADSLTFFVREVMPCLDALIGDDYVLRVAGRSGAARVRALAGERVRLLGRVEDLTGLYDDSRLFIAPTRFAAGVPMKIHEAAAMGLPVAATTLLATQLGWRDERELAVGDGAEGFAQACARAYGDPLLWGRLRAGALARVAADCDPAVFAARLASALEAAAGR